MNVDTKTKVLFKFGSLEHITYDKNLIVPEYIIHVTTLNQSLAS